MKKHAKDYLIEFVNGDKCNPWLKYLVYQIINTNKPLSENDVTIIINHLTKNKELPNIDIMELEESTNNDISLISMKHISGVNALAENQTIKFHHDITMLYGRNGSGKSSYFRALNEIVGGSEQRAIISNIYKEKPQEIKVELEYKAGDDRKQKIVWDGNTRGIKDLNNCRVFDSSYLNSFLDTRQVDETLITPLGLNLFKYISDGIDLVKNKLKELTDLAQKEKPSITMTSLSEDIQYAIQNNNVSEKQQKYIEKMYCFPEESQKQLDEIEKELKEINQTNVSDTIELSKRVKEKYKSFNAILKKTNDELKQEEIVVKDLIRIYYVKSENNKSAKNKFKVFNSIPANDSEEWKQFIIAGKKYNEKAGILKECPYCRQSLSDDAKALLLAYADYLQDKSEKELEDAIYDLSSEYDKIYLISINDMLDSDIEKLFENHKTEKGTAIELVKNLLANQKARKEKLLSIIENRNQDAEIEVGLEEKPIVAILEAEVQVIEKKITELENSCEKRDVKVKELDSKIKKLLENKAISAQKKTFQKWFEKDKEGKTINTIVNSLSTKDISILSGQAHEDLLTETLRDNFKNELLQIGIKNIEISLVKDKSSKGTMSTKILLKKAHKPKEILSEGEQKAVGLALFLAEIKSQNCHNPIILDDPVNSLDHKYSGNIATRLMMMDNQIVIFNHNLLFLNAFETSPLGHICKTIDSDCNKTRGKHIRVYSVQSEDKDRKGILSQYNMQKANRFLSEAAKLLSITPFGEHQNVAVCLRRCVECCIDEVIFNNQIPTKYHTKSNRIDWNALSKMKTDSDLIEKLHTIHDRVSGGELHNGIEAGEDSIEKDEFKTMLKTLQEIIEMKKQIIEE